MLIFITFNYFQTQKSYSSIWKEMMDSCVFHYRNLDFETALKWAKLAQPPAEKEAGPIDTNYVSVLKYINNIYHKLNLADSSLNYLEIYLKKYKEMFKVIK